jgi:hypothetical protein
VQGYAHALRTGLVLYYPHVLAAHRRVVLHLAVMGIVQLEITQHTEN